MTAIAPTATSMVLYPQAVGPIPAGAPVNENGTRFVLSVDNAEYLAYSAKRSGVSVLTDLATGDKYAVSKAACGLGCRCDAVAFHLSSVDPSA